MKIGAQLYTVRAHTQTLDDFAKTLEKIAKMGYEYVQVSGTCAYDGKWLDEQLKKNHLKCPITHYSFDDICTRTEQVVKKHQQFGCDHIGIGWYALNEDFSSLLELRDKICTPNEVIAKSGLTLTYHNHNHEFYLQKDGKPYLYWLTELLPSLHITLDVYWAKKGGYDPCQVIQKLQNRISCVHLKDMSKEDEKFEVVGDGLLDFPSILKALEEAKTEYAFVEQDDCYGKDPFECLKKSREYLKTLGY